MSIWRQFANVFAEMRQAATGEAVASKVYQHLMQWHRPEDVGEPGAPRPYCLWCKTDWPCDEFVRLSDSLREVAEKLKTLREG
jgi:hypothetical protein